MALKKSTERQYKSFTEAAVAAVKAINAKRNHVFSAAVVSQPVAGAGKPPVDDAIREAKIVNEENKMTATRFGKKRFEHFVVAASAAAARINTEREQVLGAGVVNKLRQTVAGAGNSRVDDAIRKARKISRNRLASTFRFLEECGQHPARRKPSVQDAIREAGVVARNEIKGMLQFLKEKERQQDQKVKRKPATRPAKKIRGGAAKKSRK